MALLDKSGIINGGTVESFHVSNIYDALNESGSYEIIATGSFTGSFTGNLSGTASYANASETASYVLNAVSASFSTTASYAVSASYEINYETSSSYAETASIATSASYATSASTSETASYVLNAVSSSFASTSITASYIETAQTASYVLNAVSASFATSASHTPNTFVQNGNSFGTTARLGTNDSQPIVFETNNSQRMNISASGTIGMGNDSNGTLYTILNNETSTLGITTSTLFSLSTAANYTYTVHAYVMGGTTTNTIGGEAIAVFRNNSGTLTQVGTTITSSISDFSGAPSFTFDSSGTNIRLRVTGVALTTINWAGSMRYIQFDFNA